jgi:AcrR family transcriptional regulator
VCNNLVMAAPSIRARVRTEMIGEIKAIARRHLVTDGANLSLRAVARDMGMVSSALYRYFASRDDLLTALIIDAYDKVADAAEAGDASVADRSDGRARWLATSIAIRSWALANPAEYALIYGSPVPGYAAPPDTIVPATRIAAVLIRILSDAYTAGKLTDTGSLPVAVRADLTAVRDAIFPELPETVLMRGMIGWIHLFGAISFELFGQLNNVIKARDEFFALQMGAMADLIGL